MTANCCDKKESGRFQGEGVSFRAKLIGVLEVGEARGDRMCQEALADLKMAVRAAGEHKQRIQVHVAIDGLRLRDDKTGDSLYHHPVHKISFIAQDMSDSRAFGYIFGSPDTGHRFFGIKTDKAAGHVVIAMRDLFQVVFELKKKEIELARQQLEIKSTTSSSKHQDSEHGQSLGLMRWPILQSTNGDTSSFKLSEVTVKSLSSNRSPGLNLSGSGSGSAAVAELVDLEQELSSLRRGLNEMESLTPKDPFGDSFAAGPSSKGSLPPPPGISREGRTRSSGSSGGYERPESSAPFSPAKPNLDSPRHSIDRSSLDPHSILANYEVVEEKPSNAHSQIFDVFTELDPLGTGRSKPYVDKKHFFQELKNPPKKVLKDLVPGAVPSLLDSSINFMSSFESSKPETLFTATTITSVNAHSGGSVSISKPAQTSLIYSTPLFTDDPFAETDPFDSTDPFSDSQKDDPFVSASTGFSLGHFRELGLAKGPPIETIRDQKIDDNGRVKFIVEPLSIAQKNVFNGPLQVTLPPEPSSKSPRLSRQGSDGGSSATARRRPSSGGRRAEAGASPPPPPLPPKKAGGGAGGAGAGGVGAGARPALASSPPPALPSPSRRPRPGRARRLSPPACTPPPAAEDDYLTPIPPPPPQPLRSEEPPGRPPHSARRRAEPQEPPKTMGKLEDSDFKANFEDNFSQESKTNDSFVANFDKFCVNDSSSYDRYAAFREIQEETLKLQQMSNYDDDDELTSSKKDDSKNSNLLVAKEDKSRNSSPRPSDDSGQFLSLNANERSPDRRSPLRSLDELAFDSLGAFSSMAKSKDSKLNELKSVINNLHKSSQSPKLDSDADRQSRDRYAALRDIATIRVTGEEAEAAPPDAPKERKRSDERSDGFDNSDFFDCIDNSSLSLSHGEEAPRKSPLVLKESDKRLKPSVVEEKKLRVELVISPISPTNLLAQPPSHISAGSLSDIVSGSSPEIGTSGEKKRSGAGERDKERERGRGRGRGRGWEEGASPWSSESPSPPPPAARRPSPRRPSPRRPSPRRERDPPPRPRRRAQQTRSAWHSKQTSSSSRDVSPWDEDPPKSKMHPRPQHSYRERKDSASSKDRHDSGSGRDKEAIREHRDSGSGRDRDRDLRDRDRRDRDRIRNRDRELERDREYEIDTSKERSREMKSREKDRERHRRRHHSWDDEDGYSDGRTSHASGSRRYSPGGGASGASSGCSAGRSSRETRDSRGQAWQGHAHYRDDDRAYATVGRSSRRRDMWQTEESARYSGTMVPRGRRSGSSRSRESEGRNQSRRQQQQQQHYYHRSPKSPFEDDFAPPARYPTTPSPRSDRESPRSSRPPRPFPEEGRSGSRLRKSPAPQRPSPPGTSADNPPSRFRFSNDFSERESSKSQNSPFDDDFGDAPALKKPSRYAEAAYSSFDGESPTARKPPAPAPAGGEEAARGCRPAPPPSPPRAESPAPERAQSPSRRSLFEDDFSPEPRNGILRREPIAEEEEGDAADASDRNSVAFRFGDSAAARRRRSQNSRSKFKARTRDPDLKKSESINIFARDDDPFAGDDFFSCTGSDRAASKDRWPGDFANFDDA